MKRRVLPSCFCVARSVAKMAKNISIGGSWKIASLKTLRTVWRCEGRYLLRTNLTEIDPAKRWEFYLQLTQVEPAFKELKATWPCARSIINSPTRSKRTSSSRSWPILFASDPPSATAPRRQRPHAARRAGEVRRRADARRASPHHGRTRDRDGPPHAAGERPPAPARSTQAGTARAKPAEDPGNAVSAGTRREMTASVVQTFGANRVKSSHSAIPTLPVRQVGLVQARRCAGSVTPSKKKMNQPRINGEFGKLFHLPSREIFVSLLALRFCGVSVVESSSLFVIRVTTS